MTYRPSYRTGPVVHSQKERNRKKLDSDAPFSLYAKQNNGKLRWGQKTSAGGGYVRYGWGFSIALSSFPSATEQSFFYYHKLVFFFSPSVLFPNNYSHKPSNAQVSPIQSSHNILSIDRSFPMLCSWLQEELSPWISKNYTEEVNPLFHHSTLYPVDSILLSVGQG